jgi:hypothetical protein
VRSLVGVTLLVGVPLLGLLPLCFLNPKACALLCNVFVQSRQFHAKFVCLFFHVKFSTILASIVQAGPEASPAGGGGWAGARETQTSAPHRASSVGIGAQGGGGASACAGSSLVNSAGAQCARDWAQRALAPTPGASRPHAQ